MVSPVRTLPSPDDAGLDAWLAALVESYPEPDTAMLRRAIDFVRPLYDGRYGPGGVSLFEHALGCVAILADLRMDFEALAAAVLHAVPALPDPPLDTLTARFGAAARLAEGVARMSQIQGQGALPEAAADQPDPGGVQAEAFRQMLLAMVEDIRVVIIKLAERAQTLRELAECDVPERARVATEVMEVFAPLANRLGIWQLKWELEDLSFRFLEPERYRQVVRLLDEKRADRQRFIDDFIEALQALCDRAGVRAAITGRPKHIVSIIRKMTRKHKTFEQIYDVRAVRVMVETVQDCYAMLSLIHQTWQPIPGEFDDYIAQPKANNYQALHTAVIGPGDKAVEVQICTQEMYQHAEYGVAAHWRYKEGRAGDRAIDDKISWLRQIVQWKEDIHDAADLVDRFKSELFADKVYVLTPQGRVIDLAHGATPIDFAYAVHTDLGHRCRGALIDGNIVPLNTELENGQRVEILTARNGTPSRDWLLPQLGYVRTHRARAKIRAWFRQQNLDADMATGRALIERELRRLNAEGVSHERVAHACGHASLDHFLAALGRGDLGISQVIAAIEAEIYPQTEAVEAPVISAPRADAGAGKILLAGQGNLLTAMAGCCKPLPPDPIAGYIARGRGAVIHRSDCPNLLRLAKAWPDRVQPATWGRAQSGPFAADIAIEALERNDLMRDLAELFSRERISVTAMAGQVRRGRTRVRYTVETSDGAQLTRLLGLIEQVPGVVDVSRR